jgi:hypothetical protein
MKRKAPIHLYREPRWKFPAYCLAIVGIIVAGVLIVQALSNVFP